jgi:hypothetical protein
MVSHYAGFVCCIALEFLGYYILLYYYIIYYIKYTIAQKWVE